MVTAGIECPLPDRIPVLPIRSTVVFPMGATALQVSYAPNVEVLSTHPEKDLLVAVVSVAEDHSEIEPLSLEKVAVATRVLDRLNLPGGTIQATLQGLCRIRLEEVRFQDGYYTARPVAVTEGPLDPSEAEPLVERVLSALATAAARIDRIPDEAPRILRMNVTDPSRFADLAATLAQFKVGDRDETLQRLDVRERLEFVLSRLDESLRRMRELDAGDGAPQRRDGAPRTRAERTTDIRNTIRRLQGELGQADPAEKEALDLLRQIDRAQLPARVAAVSRREAERLRTAAPGSAEAAEIRSYVDTVLRIPWKRAEDLPPIRVEAVRAAMDERHVGLEDVKRRILEIVSVAQLRGDVSGLIPCLVGPPGVGKRSLAAAIARGLGRPLVRVELGGRGEAQLMGSRRTRNTAQPGKLVTALEDAGVSDPVFLLEELDEIGLGNVEGDPVEAMEEFLDPRNRSQFIDRYLDVPIDLSGTALIATAQDFFRIPRALRDFLIEIRIPGYTPEEKVQIARRCLVPRLATEHGFDPSEVEIPDESLLFITRSYARDAGLGNLRRMLSAMFRSIALSKASEEETSWTLTPARIEEILGIPRYPSTVAEIAPEVGIVTGLAWTASGGEIMFIEALKMPGTGRLIITGYLGEVMRESVSAAYSYVRSRADALGIPKNSFGDNDIHVHFPVGATPKDGPSAGAAVTLAIASSLAERAVRHDVAMTGEVTLRGRILDIGGVKEKILAAYRAGIREVILPTGNERDLRDVPLDVREAVRVHLVDRMDEVIDIALEEDGAPESRRRGSGRTRRTGRAAARGGAPAPGDAEAQGDAAEEEDR
jgi:ATP-dependent Lon protease